MKYDMGLSRKETTRDENNTIAARDITAYLALNST
jgi:hypothetical protein